jgi:receptor expression-enhancing protein 1/2/3/4
MDRVYSRLVSLYPPEGRWPATDRSYDRIPFYPWIRAGFLLYLIAPQTQGAKLLYQNHVHPFLREHEVTIEDFISSAHERAKTAGLNYLKQAIELLKQHVLGLPPAQPSPPQAATTMSYTQSLIARFNLPSARPSVSNLPTSATSTATDFYSLLASAVTAASSTATSRAARSGDSASYAADLSNSGTLIPPTITGAERVSFISAQRERLSILLSALDKEASILKSEEYAAHSSPRAISSMFFDGNGEDQPRPASAMSGLSKSRSEADFEKIEADDDEHDQHIRPIHARQPSGGWLPWSWGARPAGETKEKEDEDDISGISLDKGKSSGFET